MLPLPSIDWSRVTHIMAIKEDLAGYEAISVLIRLDGEPEPVTVQPETAGYSRFVQDLHRQVPGIQPGWRQALLENDLPCCEQVLYQRDVATEGE